ncbi:hypothetical protein CN947_23380 [Bacillus cereus]|nr:hypothetical protein CN947_23380 [Bacillus cereus]
MHKAWNCLLKRLVQMSNVVQGTDRRVEMMRLKKTEKVVGRHRFMVKFPKNKDAPFCIVEGEDEKYYELRVKMRCDNIEPICIPCGGKSKVIDTYEWIIKKPEYSKGKIMYFIDRDFDELYNNSLIYETPFYSIENFYTTDEAISKIFRNTFKFDEFGDHYKIAMELFKERQKEFHESTKLFNAWIMCQRDISAKQKKSRVPLAKVSIEDYVSINLDSVTAKYTLETIRAKFPEAHEVSEEELNNKIKELDGRVYQEIFRGKFEGQFLRKFLELLQTDVCSKEPRHFPTKIKVSLNMYDLVAQFSNYATTPNCLINYINNIWLPKEAAV